MIERLISAHAGDEGSVITVIALVEGTSSLSLPFEGRDTRTPDSCTARRAEIEYCCSSVSPLDSGDPTTPFRTILSIVNVPVLSKQRTSNFPANGILKGSVQNTNPLLRAASELVTVKNKNKPHN